MRKSSATSLLQALGSGLKQARIKKGLAQRALGNIVGLPQSHISKIEQGGVDLQLSSLSQLARALDLEVRLVPRAALPAIDGLIHSLTMSAGGAQQPALSLDDEDEDG